jgi:hypothetical protein
MIDMFSHRRRGSALLIVLGFLTFMMISAVSFAIFMRIERQASSNYRHTITGRHLLNAALARAIDEIDSELRVDQTTSRDGTVDVRARKFPAWPGRTKPSAVPNGLDNGNDARVLSLEALSFIPGIFVHDVRRYAVSNRFDQVKGVDAGNNKYSYMGAKWRPLSMPVSTIAGGENAYDEAVVGRYSYVCVNLSDMFNVNACAAALRTNGVSIGHLFGAVNASSENLRRQFDDNAVNTDSRYTTLQDFYACMYARNDPTFGSPYHEYVNAGSDNKADYVFSGVNGTLDGSISANVLVTDGIVKQEPSRNVSGVSFTRRGGADVSQIALAAEAFGKQLVKVPRLRVNDADSGAKFFKSMLVDYLDEDSEPYWESGIGVSPLYRPSVEMTPQIFQIVIDTSQQNLKPIIITESLPGAGTPGAPVSESYLHLAQGPQITVNVRTMFPFKDWNVRKQKEQEKFAFTMEARAFLVAVPGSANLRTSAIGSQLQNLNTSAVCFELSPASLPAQDPMPANENSQITLCRTAFNVGQSRIKLYTTDSNGNKVWVPTCPLRENEPQRIALVIFVGIKQNNKFVDMVPGWWYNGSQTPGDLNAAIRHQNGISICDRLFFQTEAVPIGRNSQANLPTMVYQWASMEVADPRYNHKASNWIVSPQAVAANTLNDTLSKNMIALEGRDNDVYQFVSNGRNLVSAGEFGFLPRPYNNPAAQGTSVELATQNSIDKAEDYDKMFRTIRLYDYDTDHLSDDIYNYMPLSTPDAYLTGGRANPCSDLPQVLSAAVTGVPRNFWIASLNPRDNTDRLLMTAQTFDRIVSQSDWAKLTNAWMQCLVNARNVSQYNRLWNVNLSDVYGKLNLFGWHGRDAKTLFDATLPGGNGVPAALNQEFHEIDRKTLFAYSMDAFSDRQQLFLYILRAEATVPSFGTTQESGTKSLAGGRAVALVWRDPYPVGYDKESDGWLNKGSATWFNYLNRISPWYQVNLKYYNDDYDQDRNGDPTFSGNSRARFDGFHEHRILFFKQLDN